MSLKEYYDSYYGKVKIIPEEKFQLECTCDIEECDADSDTIIEEPHLHIEHILCRTHNREWFVQIPIKSGKK